MPHHDGRPADRMTAPGLRVPPVYSNNGMRPITPETRDDTTRYLCAATQEDDDYADAAIRECLIESTRQVPPSPGVDAGAVLAEAVAARARRKLRDWTLIMLMTAFVVVAPTFLLVVWILLALPSFLREHKKRLSMEWIKFALKVGVALAIALIVLDWAGVIAPDQGLSLGSAVEPIHSEARMEVTFALVALILGVLLTDELVVWRHLFVRFRSGERIEPIRNRAVFAAASRTVMDNLHAYIDPRPTMAQPPDVVTQGIEALYGAAPVIVYRSARPFVGAGNLFRAWSVAVPLEPLPDVARPRMITTAALYDAIAAEVGGLRHGVTLAPGMRLAGLAIGGQIVVSANELIDHLDEPAAVDFLPSLEERPYTLLRRERVQSLQTNPLEWARYYQYFRLETWDRDLVVSVFTHVAVDETALYLEWTPCLLLPIKKRYQELDAMSKSITVPLGRSLSRLMQLPASVPQRLIKALLVIHPASRERYVRPSMYGASYSLRELAQGRAVHNYLQQLDKHRYLKLMEGRLVLAVSRFMKEAGYSAASFLNQTGTVINNSVQIGGSVEGNVIAGVDNQATSSVFTPSPSTPESAD